MIANRRLRVMHLGSPTGLYGAERWILALINNIDAAHVESEVAVVLDDPRLEAPLCREAAAMGFASTVFEAHGKFSWAAVRQVREHIRSRRIDVLHSHGYKSDLIALLAARGTGCRIVTTPHGWSTGADFKLKAYEAFDRLLFYGFDAVAPLSNDIYAGLASLPGLTRRLHLIANGVDLKDIDVATTICPELANWRANGEFVLGYIGQLIPRKALEVLLQALAGWSAVAWRLAIVGEGDARDQLEGLARQLGLGDRVKFFGFRSDRISFLRSFDAFVLSSRLEGVPRCLMESMACLVPVIATDIPGCRDLIEHEQSGLLFEVDNCAGLRDALDSLAKSVSLRADLSQRARDVIERNWSAAAMANRYLELYALIVR